VRADVRDDLVGSGGQNVGIHGGQIGRRGLQPELGGAGFGDVARQFRSEEGAGNALGDGPAEQSGCPRHRQQGRNRSSTRRLAEHGDPPGIAAERADVVAHPFQRGDLVEQPPVGRRALDLREPLDADPVVEGDHDDAVAREAGAVVLGKAGHADRVRPAVDPHHHRQTRVAARIGRPDVQRQPVLATRHLVHAERVRLWGRRPERQGVANAVPWSGRCRRGEAQIADRRLREGDAAEDRHIPFDGAAHPAHRRPSLDHAAMLVSRAGNPLRISADPGVRRQGAGPRLVPGCTQRAGNAADVQLGRRDMWRIYGAGHWPSGSRHRT
jgi:hypothetical protein